MNGETYYRYERNHGLRESKKYLWKGRSKPNLERKVTQEKKVVLYKGNPIKKYNDIGAPGWLSRFTVGLLILAWVVVSGSWD